MVVEYADFIADGLFNGAFNDVAKFPQVFVEGVLTYTEEEILDCEWGRYQLRATKLLTAHRLEKFRKAGTIGGGTNAIPDELKSFIDPTSIVTSLSASQGTNSVSFTPNRSSGKNELNHSGIASAEDLESTHWGRMFLSIPQTSVYIGFVL
jgi:hypothetical protein